jgi:hypothetical protein
MSYIKLQDAKNAIMNCITEQTVSKYATSAECRAARHGADIALFALDDVPTADLVGVVRCKDCKYSEFIYSSKKKGEPSVGHYVCTSRRCSTVAEGYCHWGERREQNER